LCPDFIHVRPRVLIVDDDITLVNSLQRLLKPAFECAGYSDPERGSQAIQQALGFELAVLDIVLPSIDGWTLLDQMKQFHPNVPVVMVSGDCRPEVVMNALRRGACDFLAKPIEDIRGLSARLTEAVARAVAPRTVSEFLHRLDDSNYPLPRYTPMRKAVMDEFHKAYLTRLMRESAGNLTRASRLSGIDRSNLRRLLFQKK
jgi:DNA-binding NtrC family response regulator